VKNEFQAAIDLIASGKIEATELVTHRLSLAEIGQAFEIAADKKSGAVKVLVYQGTIERD
jgi:threonine dehydrogenase-like Zn-dependent dehydrogenase